MSREAAGGQHAPKSRTCHLLSIPVELRILIYKYAMSDDRSASLLQQDRLKLARFCQNCLEWHPASLEQPGRQVKSLMFCQKCLKWHPCGGLDAIPGNPASEKEPFNPGMLLATCKQIYTEALPFFYESKITIMTHLMDRL